MRFVRSLLIPMLLMILLFPQMTSAHSRLMSSDPEAGSTVTESLSSITLQFNEDIEPLSTIKVTNVQGEKVPVKVSVTGSKLSGSLDHPLLNNKYTVTWKIVGGDSHPVEGKYSFLVNVPETASNGDQTHSSSDQGINSTDVDHAANDPVKSNMSSVPDVVLLASLLIVIVGMYYYIARKRRK
ncbi:copper resistance CopC family protein [Paenibacillus sediminis]|uniref:Methionine-rich copper-binding protein CopC n=1 Tax=Paenibacillus sediminis TaxID=664909 RepID=A0ABS4H0D2_9BACL|nr:copper resistance CopC family protein [Paenibacillus sediminis]MBP1935985.1 methionine-rich copper-binding protein CopC [Paenibacillus sediminis]